MSHSSDHHTARYGTHGTAPGGEPQQPAPASGPVAEAARRAAVRIVNSVDANPAYHFEAKNSTAANMADIIAAEFRQLEAAAEAMAGALESTLEDIESGYISNQSVAAQRRRNRRARELSAALAAYRAVTGSGQAGAGKEGGTG